MKALLARLMVVYAVVFPLNAFAQEHVMLFPNLPDTDSPIILPEGSWYQVQTDSHFPTTICEGEITLCHVPSKDYYTVINHTAGTRVLVLVLNGSASTILEPTTPVSVAGSTVSWPSNSGWYEVQSAADYSTKCESDTSCVVDDGLYIVINHSTGERYENIRVGPDSTESVTVVGNVISWPLDGWYQVQNSTDYNSVCEGGSLCTVDPGSYIVINHTTGERFAPIIVGDSAPSVDLPIVGTAEDAFVAGMPYKSARVWLNNVVTGSSAYTGEALDSHFDFAIDPSLIERLTSGARTECVGGGSVHYLREMSAGVVVDTLQYANCVLPEGSIDGRIVLDSRQSSKVFDVAVTKPTRSMVLRGDRSFDRGEHYISDPLCSEGVLRTSERSTYRLYNSVVTEEAGSGLESHFYSNLTHYTGDYTFVGCEEFSLSDYTVYSNSAYYTHTIGDEITTMVISKNGSVASDSNVLDILSHSKASLSASFYKDEINLGNLYIGAADAQGSYINVSINDGESVTEFSEEVSFEALSDP